MNLWSERLGILKDLPVRMPLVLVCVDVSMR